MSNPLVQSAPRFAVQRQTVLGVALVLLVVAVGSHIPVPGIDLAAINQQSGGSAGSLMARLSIMALGITPLYTVLLHVELLSLIIPPFARWRVACPSNAGRLDLIIIVLALLLTALQASAILGALQESLLVRSESVAFAAVGMACFVGCTALLIWLAKTIQLPGIGSGFWLLLAIPTLASMPMEAAFWIELASTGAAFPSAFLILAAYVIGCIASVVFVRCALLSAARKQGIESASVSAMLLWPIFLAGTAAGYLIIPVALVDEEPERLLQSIPLAIPILTVVLIPLIVYAYARTLFFKRRNEQQRKAVLPVVLAVAGVQVIVFAVGEILSRSLQLPFSLPGSMLIVLTMVMLSLHSADARTDAVPGA
jgi:preprotein translocase subunit SecY